jgi:DcaP outer membrane protein
MVATDKSARPNGGETTGETGMIDISSPKRAKLRHYLAMGVAGLALLGSSAFADTPKELELEARIVALERLFGTVQTQLTTTQAENQQLRAEAAVTQTRMTEIAATQAIRIAPAAAVVTPPPADGFRVGATTIKLGGFVKTSMAFSRFQDGDLAGTSLGRDFYLPQTIPVGGTRESLDNDISTKQTRLWLNTETTVAGHVLKGYVETDFQTAAGTQGSERTTNGYNLALRRAFVTYDKLTVGQDWSTFQNVATLPESTDFIGPTEGSVFARQALVRYSTPLNAKTTLQVSLENAETASANLGSPTLVENDDDSVPDVVGRLNFTLPKGEVSVAGLVRQLSVDNGAVGDTRAGYGASVAGKFVFGTANRYDLRFMGTYGSGIGRYLGLNFVPDAVYVAATTDLAEVKSFAGFAAFKVNWTPKVRSTFMASYQEADYDSGLALASISGFNKSAYSVAGNLFWSPVKGFDLGVELRHGERELVSGASGALDRIEFVAKYGF